ncbi:bifunctional peptidase and arginyl-hydroxylase JMJD5-like [Glandiceps talaboti]
MKDLFVWLLITISTICCFICVSHGNQLPIGHLQPFGSHRPADVTIDEFTEPPDPVLFWENYVKPGKPLIVRGVVTSSPAHLLWDMAYLKEKYGGLEVRLQAKGKVYPIGAKGLGRDTISNFADTYKEKNSPKYVASQLPKPMYKDINVLPTMQCGSFKDGFVEIDVWMSGGWRSGVLHKDPFNNWNCMVQGTKVWAMVENQYHDLLHTYWMPERTIMGISSIDPQSVDLIKFPNITQVRWSNVTTHPGDCLFIPRSYYHQINSYGDPNIATGLLFPRLTDFNSTACDQVEKLKYTPLSEMLVTWNWPGHGDLTMGNNDHRFIKKGLLKGVDFYGDVRAEYLVEELKLLYPELPAEEVETKTRKAFKILDKEGKGSLKIDDVIALDLDSLRHFIVAMTPEDPSNTERFEYNYVNPADISDMIHQLIETHSGLREELFVANYVKLEGATADKARETTI